LLKALELRSVDEVSRVLREDPKAAKEVFWEPRVENPLNAAVRLKCSTEILQLLLAAGADPEVVDSSGRTAKQRLLSEIEAASMLEAAFQQEAIQRGDLLERASVAQQAPLETFMPSTFGFGMFDSIPDFALFAQAPPPTVMRLPTGTFEPFQYSQAPPQLHAIPGFPMFGSLPAQVEKREDVWRYEALQLLEARDATEVD
jgi:hypothetical protein